MTDPNNPLSRHRAPVDAGAGFRATREIGLALIEPLTPSARTWLEANVGGESQWAGPALVVEMRYFPQLADAIIAAGFLFERDPFPN